MPLRIEYNLAKQPDTLPQFAKLRIQVALLKRAKAPNQNQFKALLALLSNPNFKELFQKLSTEEQAFLCDFTNKYQKQLFRGSVPKDIAAIIDPATQTVKNKSKPAPQPTVSAPKESGSRTVRSPKDPLKWLKKTVQSGLPKLFELLKKII